MTETPTLADANVRSQTYYVARTNVRCWHCGLSTRLLALAMPRNHETLDEDAQADADRDDRASEAWQRAAVNAIIFYFERLPDALKNTLNRISPFFPLAPIAPPLNSS